MKNIIRTCNLKARFSKFTLNIEIYKEFVEFLSKLVWRKTLFLLLSESANPDSSLIDDQGSKSRIRGEGWKQWRLVRGQ